LLGDGITRAAESGVPERLKHLADAFEDVAKMIGPEEQHLSVLKRKMHQGSQSFLQIAWENMLEDLPEERYQSAHALAMNIMMKIWEEDPYNMPKKDWYKGTDVMTTEEIAQRIYEMGFEIITKSGPIAKHHELLHRAEAMKRRFPKYANDITNFMYTYERAYHDANDEEKHEVQKIVGDILTYLEETYTHPDQLEKSAKYSENLYLLLNYGLLDDMEVLGQPHAEEEGITAALARGTFDLRMEFLIGEDLWNEHQAILAELGYENENRRKYLDSIMKYVCDMYGMEEGEALDILRDMVRDVQARYLKGEQKVIEVKTGPIAKHHEPLNRAEAMKQRFPKYANDITNFMYTYEHAYHDANDDEKMRVQGIVDDILTYLEETYTHPDQLEKSAKYSENLYLLLNYGLLDDMEVLGQPHAEEEGFTAAIARGKFDHRMMSLIGEELWDAHKAILADLGYENEKRRKYLDFLMKNVGYMYGMEEGEALDRMRDMVSDVQARYLKRGQKVTEVPDRRASVSSVDTDNMGDGDQSSVGELTDDEGVFSVKRVLPEPSIPSEEEGDGAKQEEPNPQIEEEQSSEGEEETPPLRKNVIPALVMQRRRSLSRNISRSRLFSDDLKTMLENALKRIDVTKALEEVVQVVRRHFGELFSTVSRSSALTRDEYKIYNEFNNDVLYYFDEYFGKGTPGDALSKLETLFRDLIKAMRTASPDETFDIARKEEAEDEFDEVFARFSDHWEHLARNNRRELDTGIKPATREVRDETLGKGKKPKSKKQKEKEAKAAARAENYEDRGRARQGGLSEEEEEEEEEEETSSSEYESE
jgi:hypothetical protein